MLVAAQIGRKVVASAAVAVAAVAAVGCVKDGLYLLLQQMEWEHFFLSKNLTRNRKNFCEKGHRRKGPMEALPCPLPFP